MTLAWSSLTCKPDEEALGQLAESWGWLLTEPFVPVLFSVFGDVFFEPDSGGIWWLNTGTAEVSRVAHTVQEFGGLLGTDLANDWFMPDLIESLQAAGKFAGAGQCYSYVVLPVFAEGRYEVENLNPVPVHEHFGLTGRVLRELRSLPDGALVRLKVGP
jgi:hypothetical protein